MRTPQERVRLAGQAAEYSSAFPLSRLQPMLRERKAASPSVREEFEYFL
jgi:hypothetical protein